MRTLLLTGLLAIAALAPLAAADHPASCSAPAQGNGPLVQVKVYRGDCAGATVAFPRTACTGGGEETFGPVHVVLLADDRCETGVVAEVPV